MNDIARDHKDDTHDAHIFFPFHRAKNRGVDFRLFAHAAMDGERRIGNHDFPDNVQSESERFHITKDFQFYRVFHLYPSVLFCGIQYFRLYLRKLFPASRNRRWTDRTNRTDQAGKADYL